MFDALKKHNIWTLLFLQKISTARVTLSIRIKTTHYIADICNANSYKLMNFSMFLLRKDILSFPAGVKIFGKFYLLKLYPFNIRTIPINVVYVSDVKHLIVP